MYPGLKIGQQFHGMIMAGTKLEKGFQNNQQLQL